MEITAYTEDEIKQLISEEYYVFMVRRLVLAWAEAKGEAEGYKHIAFHPGSTCTECATKEQFVQAVKDRIGWKD